MSHSFLRVFWTTEVSEVDDEDNGIGLFTLVDGTFIRLMLSSCDSFFDHYISNAGSEFFTDDIKIMTIVKEYIYNELSPNLKKILWKQPNDGDFIMVFNIQSFQTNHPLDSVEYDLNVDPIGILGEQVKLVYKKSN